MLEGTRAKNECNADDSLNGSRRFNALIISPIAITHRACSCVHACLQPCCCVLQLLVVAEFSGISGRIRAYQGARGAMAQSKHNYTAALVDEVQSLIDKALAQPNDSAVGSIWQDIKRIMYRDADPIQHHAGRA